MWVANHPPLHYVAVAPLIWFAEATDRPDGGLLLMRLANLAFAAVGVVFTYLLATELTGGVRRIGLAAAAIVALVPQGHTYFSRGLNDGLAFAAGTGLLWAGAALLAPRRPPQPRPARRHGGGRLRHADGNDAARGRGRRRRRC